MPLMAWVRALSIFIFAASGENVDQFANLSRLGGMVETGVGLRRMGTVTFGCLAAVFLCNQLLSRLGFHAASLGGYGSILIGRLSWRIGGALNGLRLDYGGLRITGNF